MEQEIHKTDNSEIVKNTQHMETRMYENKFPNINDLVMVRIK
jgi:hypothetical protein